MSSDDAATPHPRVLFQITGSIAAYKACSAISALVQDGCEVQTVATPAALRFVGAATLEGLTGRPVATEVFEAGRAMDHIHLARWADVMVLCPATANLVNKLAAGVGDDLVSTLFLAHDFTKPYVVVPAMNTAMYHHPATQRSLATLRGWGLDVIDPVAGSLACGEVGAGRLPEHEVIVGVVRGHLGRLHSGRTPARVLQVLITSGGTRVPIDGVRSIVNTSTGTTGAALADRLAAAGHAVTLVHADTAVLPTRTDIERREFSTFADLDQTLQRELAATSFDAVIHLAAVSDFDVDHLVVGGNPVSASPGGKLESGDTLEIHLRRNAKLLPLLKSYADNDPLVIGFKLTNGATEAERLAAVAAIAKSADVIVHNDLTEIGPGHHPATIYRGVQPVAHALTNDELADRLLSVVTDLLPAVSS